MNNKIDNIMKLINKNDDVIKIKREIMEAYDYIVLTEKESEYQNLDLLKNKFKELIDIQKEIEKNISKEGENLAKYIIKNNSNRYTLNKLKEDINNRNIKLKTIYNYSSKTLIDNEYKGLFQIREIGIVQTNCFTLISKGGHKSFLYYPKSKNMFYYDKYLVIYSDYNGELEFIYEIIRD